MPIRPDSRVSIVPAAMRRVGWIALALGIVPTLILLADVFHIWVHRSVLSGTMVESTLRWASVKGLHAPVIGMEPSPVRDALLIHVPFVVLLFGLACFSRRLVWPRMIGYALLLVVIVIILAEFVDVPLGQVLSSMGFLAGESSLSLTNWLLTWCIDLLLPIVALAHVRSAQKNALPEAAGDTRISGSDASGVPAALPVLEYSQPGRRWDLPRVICVIVLIVGALAGLRLALEMGLMVNSGFDRRSFNWPYSLPLSLPGEPTVFLLDCYAEYSYRLAWLCIAAGAWRAIRSDTAGIAWFIAASILLLAWGGLESASMLLAESPLYTVGGHTVIGVRPCIMLAFAQLATPVLLIPLLRDWRMG